MNKIILLLTMSSVYIYTADHYPWAAKDYPLAHIGKCSKALLAAAQDGNIKKVREHLDSGALIGTFYDESRETPLHLATWGGHKDVVQELLVRGADVLACDANGQTPLHYAAMTGNSEMVTILAKLTYNREPRNSNGQTPADLAKQRGYNNIVQCIDEIDLYIRRSHSLLEAAREGDADEVRDVLNFDVNINILGGSNYTPLHFAAGNGCSEIVKILLESGADTGAKNNKSKTPTDLAQKYGYDDIVQLIRDHDNRKSALNQ